jgi:hypothetical protein
MLLGTSLSLYYTALMETSKKKKTLSIPSILLVLHFYFFSVKYGILAPLVAQIGKDADVAEFLDAGYSIVQNDEPDTIQWFAVKYDSVAPNTTFAIFDTFTSEAGRQAHLNGQVPVALSANAARLLVPEPVDIRQVEVLASKVEKVAVASDKKAGLSVGLRVLIEAKPEKVQTVRQFLTVSVIIAMLTENHSIALTECPFFGQRGISNSSLVCYLPPRN